jgi:hypothetical protein
MRKIKAGSLAELCRMVDKLNLLSNPSETLSPGPPVRATALLSPEPDPTWLASTMARTAVCEGRDGGWHADGEVAANLQWPNSNINIRKSGLMMTVVSLNRCSSCGFLIAEPSQADSLAPAFLEGGSAQSAITGRARKCLAVQSRRHVFCSDSSPCSQGCGARSRLSLMSWLFVPGRTAGEAEADRCAVFKGEDIAIVGVTGVGNLAECGQPLIGIANIDSFLGLSNDMSLSVAGERGQYQNIPMMLRAGGAQSPDTFAVEAKSASVKLTGGMSGGLIYIGNNLVGMLLSVPTDVSRANREGSMVLRIDHVATLRKGHSPR